MENGDYSLTPNSPCIENGQGNIDIGAFQYNSHRGVTLTTVVPKSINSAMYHALLIGVDEYLDRGWPDLKHPLSDASKLSNVLVSKYGFEKENVKILSNPNRSKIITALDSLLKELEPVDNLIIFFAGHGYWKEEIKEGFWIPSDAGSKYSSNWLANSRVLTLIRGMQTQHTLVIADACFGGTIFQRARSRDETVSLGEDAVENLYNLRSRRAITSGPAKKEVPDRSNFMKYLIQNLESNKSKYLRSKQLFLLIQNQIMVDATNVIPLSEPLDVIEHEGGDFIFVRK